MQCPFCQNDLGGAQSSCPHCGRAHAPQVAEYITQGWNALRGGADEQARAAFSQALRATPPNDKPQIQSYISYLVQQAGGATTEADQAQSIQASGTPQSATVSAPAARAPASPSSTGAAKNALFLNFNEKPANIVRVMDDARRKQTEFAAARKQRMWIIALLLPAGLPFICADWALGYNLCTFNLVTLVLWAAAIAGLVWLLIKHPTTHEFGPQFDIARTIFETIKDDLALKRTLIGWLDLTGAQQSGKIVRQHTSTSGMPVAFYRDEWLRMKMPLYDGNVMRVSAIERVKAKLGRWKTGQVSRKRKWKAGGTVWARRELRVAITVNQEAYETLPIQTNQAGKFMIEATPSDAGHIILKATTDQAISALDVLQVLRFAYNHLRPRGATQSL